VEFGGETMLPRNSLGLFHPLGDDGLVNGGMHCPFLSVESCFSTAIRMD